MTLTVFIYLLSSLLLCAVSLGDLKARGFEALIKVKIERNIFFIVVTAKKLGILLRPAQTLR